MLNKETIYKLLKYYQLISEDIIILSGASLVLQGVKRETKDIDLAVSYEYATYLLNNFDCTLEFYNYDQDYGVYYIDNIINFSINYYDVEYIMVNGYKVQSLESVIRIKEQLNRPKDWEDIIKIKKYIRK